MTEIMNTLPSELFIRITEHIGQKIGSRVCKAWEQQFEIILNDHYLFKLYCDQREIIIFLDTLDVCVIKNIKCRDLFVFKIIDDNIFNNNLNIYDEELSKWYRSQYIKEYYYLAFKHLLVNICDNKANEYMNKIIDEFNDTDQVKNLLLEECLDNKFYNGVNFLIAKGAHIYKYLTEKIESYETEISILEQLEYLVKLKAINLGWLYFHIFKERSEKGLPRIVLGNYLHNMVAVVNDHLSDKTQKKVMRGRTPIGVLTHRVYYIMDKTSKDIMGFLTRHYLPTTAFFTIIKNYINQSGLPIHQVINDFKYFIENHIIDLTSFYIKCKEYNAIHKDPQLYEFQTHLKSLIHKNILIYL